MGPGALEPGGRRAYHRIVLRVRLLDEFEVRVGTRLVEPPASHHAWELLAWLALHPGDHPRSVVAARFWPGVLDRSARASLRSAAWAMRRALGADGGGAVRAGRERIGLLCSTDVARFDRLVEQGALEQAASLAHGPLLADFDEDWVLEARAEHTDRLATVLVDLADTARSPRDAVAHARRRLALEPLDEAADHDLMDRLVAAGDRAGALAVHDRLVRRLRTQLALAPSAQTRAAARRVRAT